MRGMKLIGEAAPYDRHTGESGGLRRHLIPLTLILSHPGEETLQHTSSCLWAYLLSVGRGAVSIRVWLQGQVEPAGAEGADAHPGG
jgi:hypothetical protein